MISNIELTSDVESDENYNLMFNRKKKETFLTLSPKVLAEINQPTSPFMSYQLLENSEKIDYINKYLSGKRDHSIDRTWNIQKGMFGWAVGYLLLR